MAETRKMRRERLRRGAPPRLVAHSRAQRRHRVRWWRAAIAAGAAIVVVAALMVVLNPFDRGEQTQHGAAISSTQAPAPASTVPLSVPDIRITAAAFNGGRHFVLSEHAQKPTLVYAMAAWCLTCIPEAKALVQLEREMGDQVNILVLDIDPGDSEAMLERFAKGVGGAPGIWALDRDSAVARAYGIRSLDTTVIIAGGREVSRTFGPQSLAQLRAAVARIPQAGQ
jgi:thioredoxin-like negative regulator of GroEL